MTTVTIISNTFENLLYCFNKLIYDLSCTVLTICEYSTHILPQFLRVRVWAWLNQVFCFRVSKNCNQVTKQGCRPWEGSDSKLKWWLSAIQFPGDWGVGGFSFLLAVCQRSHYFLAVWAFPLWLLSSPKPGREHLCSSCILQSYTMGSHACSHILSSTSLGPIGQSRSQVPPTLKGRGGHASSRVKIMGPPHVRYIFKWTISFILRNSCMM